MNTKKKEMLEEKWLAEREDDLALMVRAGKPKRKIKNIDKEIAYVLEMVEKTFQKRKSLHVTR